MQPYTDSTPSTDELPRKGAVKGVVTSWPPLGSSPQEWEFPGDLSGAIFCEDLNFEQPSVLDLVEAFGSVPDTAGTFSWQPFVVSDAERSQTSVTTAKSLFESPTQTSKNSSHHPWRSKSPLNWKNGTSPTSANTSSTTTTSTTTNSITKTPSASSFLRTTSAPSPFSTPTPLRREPNIEESPQRKVNESKSFFESPLRPQPQRITSQSPIAPHELPQVPVTAAKSLFEPAVHTNNNTHLTVNEFDPATIPMSPPPFVAKRGYNHIQSPDAHASPEAKIGHFEPHRFGFAVPQSELPQLPVTQARSLFEIPAGPMPLEARPQSYAVSENELPQTPVTAAKSLFESPHHPVERQRTRDVPYPDLNLLPLSSGGYLFGEFKFVGNQQKQQQELQQQQFELQHMHDQQQQQLQQQRQHQYQQSQQQQNFIPMADILEMEERQYAVRRQVNQQLLSRSSHQLPSDIEIEKKIKQHQQQQHENRYENHHHHLQQQHMLLQQQQLLRQSLFPTEAADMDIHIKKEQLHKELRATRKEKLQRYRRKKETKRRNSIQQDPTQSDDSPLSPQRPRYVADITQHFEDTQQKASRRQPAKNLDQRLTAMQQELHELRVRAQHTAASREYFLQQLLQQQQQRQQQIRAIDSKNSWDSVLGHDAFNTIRPDNAYAEAFKEKIDFSQFNLHPTNPSDHFS